VKAASPLLFIKSILITIVLFGGVYSVDAENLPGEVKAYYRAHNFVTAFSTPLERTALFKTPVGSPLSARLAEIKTALDRIMGQRLKMGSPRATKNDASSGISEAMFFNVSEFRGSNNAGIARIDVFSISPETNLSMIAFYEKQPELGMSWLDRQRLEMIRQERFKTEIHFWFNINNRWVINRTRIGRLE